MKKIIILLAISLLFISPGAGARRFSRSEFVEEINVLFLRGDYTALVKKTERYLPDCRLSRSQKKEILYLEGLSYIQLGEFDRARGLFRDISKMPGDAFEEEAYIGIADSYFHERKYDNAIDAYETVIEAYPDSERLSSVYYNTALCYGAKKNTGKADAYFQKVKKRYGSSFEADKIEYLKASKKTSYYIVQLGAFGNLKNAKKLLKKLKRKKYDSYIQKSRKNGEILYRVRAGKFSNKYYAKRLLRKLRRDAFAARIIVE